MEKEDYIYLHDDMSKKRKVIIVFVTKDRRTLPLIVLEKQMVFKIIKTGDVIFQLKLKMISES